MVQRYIIELLECGVWETIDEADSLQEVLDIASSYAELFGEDRIRISTPDNAIL